MRKLTARVRDDFEFGKFKVEWTKEKLISDGGVDAVLTYFNESSLGKDFVSSLPDRRSNASCGRKTYGFLFMYHFMNGNCSLEQMEKYQEDFYARAFFRGDIPCVKACANFLRSFNENYRDHLNDFLRLQGRNYLKDYVEKNKKAKDFIIDLDSTDHVQYGEQTEGVEMNYKGNLALDSLLAFDSYGFCHGMDLRTGSTHTSVGAGRMINRVFANLIPEWKKYLRADSGYCNQEVIEQCLLNKIKFTIVAHDNMGWREKAFKITEWTPWEYSEEKKQKALKEGKELPKVELGKYMYFPGWAEGKIGFPVVLKRTEYIKDQGTLFESMDWKYYAVITNWSLYDHSLQEVMEFYQKRANCENMIREEKHNYHLVNFPLQSFIANHAYGLFALIAHNLVRHSAYLIDPDRPMFAKKFRRKFVRLPAKLIARSRGLYLKFSINVKEEVEKIYNALRPGLLPGCNSS